MRLEPADKLVEGAKELLTKLEAVVRDRDVFAAQLELKHVGETEFAGSGAFTREYIGYFGGRFGSLLHQVLLDLLKLVDELAALDLI